MRTSRWLLVVPALVSLSSLARAEPPAPSRESIVETLAPFGFWSTTPEHGLVWQPSQAEVGTDFVPYVTGGKWVTTPQGTLFQSRWRWGHVVFESGSWTSDDRRGWVWIPPEAGVDHRIAMDEGPGMPPLLPSMKLRSIRYSADTEFAYPLGREWGRRLPEGTQLRFPYGNVGSRPGENVLVPERWMRAPVLRYQPLMPQ